MRKNSRPATEVAGHASIRSGTQRRRAGRSVFGTTDLSKRRIGRRPRNARTATKRARLIYDKGRFNMLGRGQQAAGAKNAMMILAAVRQAGIFVTRRMLRALRHLPGVADDRHRKPARFGRCHPCRNEAEKECVEGEEIDQRDAKDCARAKAPIGFVLPPHDIGRIDRALERSTIREQNPQKRAREATALKCRSAPIYDAAL